MSNPAQSRGLRKAGRDMLQAVLAVVAAGGTAALIDAIAGSVDPIVGIVLIIVYKILVAYAQNYLETKGTIPVLLPTPGLVTEQTGAVVDKAIGTVDATVETVQGAVADVVGTTGAVVGGLVGVVSGGGGGPAGDGQNDDDIGGI